MYDICWFISECISSAPHESVDVIRLYTCCTYTQYDKHKVSMSAKHVYTCIYVFTLVKRPYAHVHVIHLYVYVHVATCTCVHTESTCVCINLLFIYRLCITCILQQVVAEATEREAKAKREKNAAAHKKQEQQQQLREKEGGEEGGKRPGESSSASSASKDETM